jgi:hypothetical protein
MFRFKNIFSHYFVSWFLWSCNNASHPGIESGGWPFKHSASCFWGPVFKSHVPEATVTEFPAFIPFLQTVPSDYGVVACPHTFGDPISTVRQLTLWERRWITVNKRCLWYHICTRERTLCKVRVLECEVLSKIFRSAESDVTGQWIAQYRPGLSVQKVERNVQAIANDILNQRKIIAGAGSA